jgi:hypothetical protein
MKERKKELTGKLVSFFFVDDNGGFAERNGVFVETTQ